MNSVQGRRCSERLRALSNCDEELETKKNFGKRLNNAIDEDPKDIAKVTKKAKVQGQEENVKVVKRRSERLRALKNSDEEVEPDSRSGKHLHAHTSKETKVIQDLIKPAIVQGRRSSKKVPKRDSGKENQQEIADYANDLDEKENLAENDVIPDSDSNSPEWLPKGKSKKVPHKKKSAGMTANSLPKEKKKRKTKFEKINDQLAALGFRHHDGFGNCARAAIYRGHINFSGKSSDLEQVIVSGTMMCGHKCDAKLKDLLEQPDYGGNDYEDGLQEATVICPECAPDSDASDEELWADSGEGRTYVTGICSGDPRFDSGKFHNHCTDCNKFGKCIGDYREMHCHGCGGHYFGSGGRFPCPRCGGGDDYFEDGEDCVLM